MNINEIISDKKNKLGLSDVEVANLSGLSIHEYCDVEQYHDEFLSAISLKTAKNICEALKLEFVDVFREKTSIKQIEFFSEGFNQVLSNSGVNRFELAEKIGFEERVIISLEKNICNGVNLPINVILDIEKCLGLNRLCFVYFLWSNCN